MPTPLRYSRLYALLLVLACAQAGAHVLPEAEEALRIPLAAAPASRPMGVAHLPGHDLYFIAEGGFAPRPDEHGILSSKSAVHAYTARGQHLRASRPNLDSRAIYFNPRTRRIEIVTYNVSSAGGFTPNTGIYGLVTDAQGLPTGDSEEISGGNPAFGSPHVMPGFDAAGHRYFAKQGRSNQVLVVVPGQLEAAGEIRLDLAAAQVAHDDLSDHFIAYTGVAGEELALLDVDHKAILVFDLRGRFVGRSALPQQLKLRATNHISGLGYANGLFFVYHEPEGEFGTYYGFRFSAP